MIKDIFIGEQCAVIWLLPIYYQDFSAFVTVQIVENVCVGPSLTVSASNIVFSVVFLVSPFAHVEDLKK